MEICTHPGIIGSENYSGMHPNDAFPLKWKMFKHYLITRNMNIDLFMPRNQKQVNIVVDYIKENYK